MVGTAAGGSDVEGVGAPVVPALGKVADEERRVEAERVAKGRPRSRRGAAARSGWSRGGRR